MQESITLEAIIPHTDEWYEARCGRITSSEVDKIFVGGRSKDVLFGKGALTYLNIKVAEILTKEQKEISGKPLDYGIAEEQWARKKYAETTNQTVTDGRFYIYNELFAGTNDGEIEDLNGIIEIKSPYCSENHIAMFLLNSADELREYDFGYYAQCQANILIKKANWCDFISWDDRIKNPDFKIKIIRVYPDAAFQKELLYRLDEAAGIISEKIESILSLHENNLQYRIAS